MRKNPNDPILRAHAIAQQEKTWPYNSLEYGMGSSVFLMLYYQYY
jgi:hypothetical protein